MPSQGPGAPLVKSPPPPWGLSGPERATPWEGIPLPHRAVVQPAGLNMVEHEIATLTAVPPTQAEEGLSACVHRPAHLERNLESLSKWPG